MIFCLLSQEKISFVSRMLAIVYLLLNIKAKTFSDILKNLFFSGVFWVIQQWKQLQNNKYSYVNLYWYFSLFVFILKNDLKKIFQLYHMFIIWKWYFKQRNYTFSANGELWSLKTEDICSLIFYNLLLF